MSNASRVHTLPIHMGVPDPVLWGLSDDQVLKLGAGLVAAGCILRLGALPVGLRAGLAVLALLAAAGCALVRVEGRHLDEWLLIVGRYWARPRTLVWTSRPAGHPWARAAPQRTGPASRGSGCAVIRHLRVTWLETEEGAA
jgi:hypothetical protein